MQNQEFMTHLESHILEESPETILLRKQLEVEARSIDRRDDQHPLNKKPIHTYLTLEQVLDERFVNSSVFANSSV